MRDKSLLHRRGLGCRLLAVLIIMGALGMVRGTAGAVEPEEISPHLYIFISSSLPFLASINTSLTGPPLWGTISTCQTGLPWRSSSSISTGVPGTKLSAVSIAS